MTLHSTLPRALQSLAIGGALSTALVLAAAAPSQSAPTRPAEARGTGPWASFGCSACTGLIVGAGGGSILGTLAVIGAYPEAAAACGLVCAYAIWTQ